MASKSGKGGEFERELSYDLSNWWETGRSDIFWRAGSSGARATTRAKKGKQTKGHHGDLAATDPAGQPLMDLITFECKRGYSTRHPYELLDRGDTGSPGGAIGEWEGFIAQAIIAQEAAGTPYWALIHRRNLKNAWIFHPLEMAVKLRPHGGFIQRPLHYLQMRATVRHKKWHDGRQVELFGCPWVDWLQLVTPRSIRRLLMEVA